MSGSLRLNDLIFSILVLLILNAVAACGGNDDSGDSGITITITKPTDLSSYQTTTDQLLLNIGGDTSGSPEKGTYELVCDCIGWACIAGGNGSSSCTYEYFERRVDITLINETTGSTGSTIAYGQDSWSVDISLELGFNTIVVKADDHLGHTGQDSILIFVPGIDVVAPSVISTNPIVGEKAAMITKPVTVSFSERMDKLTFNNATISLIDGSGVRVAGRISAGPYSRSVVFMPTEALRTGETYTMTVSTGVKDLARNPLTAEFELSFSTTGIQAWQWSKTGVDSGHFVTTDGIGNVYVEYHKSLVIFDPYGYDKKLIKFNPDGEEIWNRPIGPSAGDVELGGMATDAAGNTYIAGSVDRGFDSHLFNGGRDIFIMKYDLTGNQVWSRLFGTSSYDYSQGIAFDAFGNVVIAGSTQGTLYGNLTPGQSAILIAKFDVDGNALWIKQPATSGWEYAAEVSADGLGNIYLIGGVKDVYSDKMFIAKYDQDGNKIWMLTDYDDKTSSIAADENGNVYIVSHLYLGKFNTNGKLLWRRDAGYVTSDWNHNSSSAMWGNNIFVDSLGKIYLTGEVPRNGEKDILALKFDENGNLLWKQEYGSLNEDHGNGVTVDSSGNVFVTGYTRGSLNGVAPSGITDAFLMKISSALNTP